jgi:hypothetical protein
MSLFWGVRQRGVARGEGEIVGVFGHHITAQRREDRLEIILDLVNVAAAME